MRLLCPILVFWRLILAPRSIRIRFYVKKKGQMEFKSFPRNHKQDLSQKRFHRMHSSSFFGWICCGFPKKLNFFHFQKKKGHFRFWNNSVLFLQRISSPQISLKYTPNFFGYDLKKLRIISFFMGKNIFSILSVFQGFLVTYFSVKLRFKKFIYPILIIFFYFESA